MKITFIYFDHMQGAQGKYYEGIASISAVLKNGGHTVKLYHITKLISCDDFIKIFDRDFSDSEIAAFSSTTNAFYYVANCARELKKKHNNILTICGGIHPTLCGEEAIREDGIDIICRGEGEYPMLELCSALEYNTDIYNIPNLWIKRRGEIVRNKTRPLIENLDLLPMPDRDLFNYDASMDRKVNRLVFLASRGCPFQCTYCCNTALKEVYPNPSSYVRFKSPDRLIAEIKQYLTKNKGIEHIIFHDDIFTLNRSWFKMFISKYSKEIRLPYVCNSRFEQLDAAVLKILKDTGCIEIQVGLESGDYFIRNEVLKRGQTEEAILRIGRLCKEIKIGLSLFTMIGIPFENARRALKTIKLTAKLNPTSVQTSIYYPYPRTVLYDICEKNGFLTNRRLDSVFERDSVLNLPAFPNHEIVFIYKNFETLTKIYGYVSKSPAPLNLLFEKLTDFAILLLMRSHLLTKIANLLFRGYFKIQN